MRFRARTAATLLALASAACLAPAAGAAEPRATKLEKVSSFVQPGVVYLTTVYSGRVEGRFVQTAGECTGFFVNPDGHFVTAGHCVDRTP